MRIEVRSKVKRQTVFPNRRSPTKCRVLLSFQRFSRSMKMLKSANLKDMRKPQRRLLTILVGAYLLGVTICTGATSIESSSIDPRDSQCDLALDPHKVMGTQSCEKCHTNELNVWKQTPHSKTFLTLHRKKEAQEIAGKLGIASFKSDSNCIQCHYTMQDHEGTLEAIAGVSCESCHGAAKEWLTIHNDYGPGASRATETAEHRRQRLTTSIKSGMRNPVNVYLVAQSCYRCHTVPDERLVNVGGHSAGSLDFELVSWSQGTVRHRFLDGQNGSNDPAPVERQRLLFVAGMIADLEHSLRATALATEKASFGITSAQRAARAAKRLESAQSRISNPVVADILKIFGTVKLKINNREELTAAAEEIRKLGMRFAATTKPETLTSIDTFIPPKDKWK